jgi:hypothetical protein
MFTRDFMISVIRIIRNRLGHGLLLGLLLLAALPAF